jgi:quercetin dioxygenase-like cupin family protein
MCIDIRRLVRFQNGLGTVLSLDSEEDMIVVLENDIQHRATPPSEMGVVYASRSHVKFNAGRRAELKYRDLGVQDATKGDMRAEVMHVAPGTPSRPTGWHYHTADIQFLMMIKGWVKLEFPDLGVIILQEGDSIMIPGGTVHQELCSSDPMELLEISLPAKLGTVNCEVPAKVG